MTELEKKIKIYETQLLIWIDIWKNEYFEKTKSLHTKELKNLINGGDCGFCFYYRKYYDGDYYHLYLSCKETCPLYSGFIFCKAWEQWKNDNFHAAAHIAWVTRRELRRLRNEKIN